MNLMIHPYWFATGQYVDGQLNLGGNRGMDSTFHTIRYYGGQNIYVEKQNYWLKCQNIQDEANTNGV